jgi:hypothetical protein
MLFSKGGYTQGFNTFLTAMNGGVLNPIGTNKAVNVLHYSPLNLYISQYSSIVVNSFFNMFFNHFRANFA